MGRDFFIPGEAMVTVKGNAATLIASTQQLGLAEKQIQIAPSWRHEDLIVDAWGMKPVDVQWMMSDVRITMDLIHFDSVVLSACITEAMGGILLTEGQVNRAGQRMGNNLPQYSTSAIPSQGNHYISLNILTPAIGEALNWWFPYCYLSEPPFTFPLGTEKSVVRLNWRAIIYTTDPWGGGLAQPATTPGTGSAGAVLWKRGFTQ